MDISLLLQFFINGCMLGMMYALVAVGFTLFFGVLDVIVFSHGDSVMLGAFAGLTAYLLITYISPDVPVWFTAFLIIFSSMAFVAFLGMLVSRFVIMPLRSAPALNTLLATMMLGTVMRESVRLFFPDGSNPKPFPRLLPDWGWKIGDVLLRFDNVALFIAGGLLIVGVAMLINHTRLGMAIRAVAQDAEAAQIMGVNFPLIVLVTFAIGSAVAAFAGLMNGLYYNEINFNLGLLLGVIGFSAAVIGGLGNIYGAILGGFVFAFLQVIGTVALPFSSAYKDVFAFGVVIILMAIFPTGMLSERQSQRV
ncbi:branched-chain amino acid ABC transporter permease [Betaproteobacteria bacterium]|nr:branched-chain amino acid ABC transporter permease [Betaproteobacteria bacterium]